jgi:predicted porin
MKKSLLALAVVAALPGVALAQSSVTISGNIKTGITRFSTDSVTGVGKIKDTAMSDGSSRIILSGTEDLGGGMAAIFQIDNRFNGNDGTSSQAYGVSPQGLLAGGNTFVGAKGGFGQLVFGNLDTHYGKGLDEFGARATSLGASSTSLLDYIGASAIAVTSRTKNVIRYNTPVMSGFSAQVDYSTAPFAIEGGTNYQTSTTLTTINPGKGQASHAEVNYKEGPIFAGVSVWDAKVEQVSGALLASITTGSVGTAITPLSATAKSGEESMKVYGSYDLGVAKIGAQYDDSKLKFGTAADQKRKASHIAVTAPIGMGAVLFQYTKANAISGIVNSGATMVSIGYDYSLSKRTSVGVNYSKINNESAANYQFFTGTALQNSPATAKGTDTSMLYAGIRHAF